MWYTCYVAEINLDLFCTWPTVVKSMLGQRKQVLIFWRVCVLSAEGQWERHPARPDFQNWVLTNPVVWKLFLSASWVWNLWCPVEWAGHQSSHNFLRLIPPLKGCHSQYLQLGMNHEDFTIAFQTCLSMSVKESKQGKKERCETQHEACATECGGAPMTRHQETGRDKYHSELLWVWWEDFVPQFLSPFFLSLSLYTSVYVSFWSFTNSL